ncbi:TcmI family type II polyketide cyclase [Streptomyces sp. IBSBF 2953]|uniref:Lct29 n=1 Tax=Streptomyces rishiriensis TaxID=68264 RepID=B0LJ12_STRRH|nr:TcmI family type II polyketide cyclase [Streptomyces scabiei]ABX71112.1 Lct29 [Streptomyces rishiriensis]MCQ9184096.1 TcmI family type II polyketide cyclase [Streptomyces hayashii]MDX3117012.1 TcmI family type II polyketide cyclase [Streptomyces scabiei]
MQRVLFIDRMHPQDADEVARIWQAHDATGLPQEIGVANRRLYRFHGLYVHLVEAQEGVEEDLTDRIFAARDAREFVETRDALAKFLTPYSPAFKNLKATRAEEFYRWQA